MARLGLLGIRLWWRRGSSAAVLAVALTATMTAVVGPMYAGAASESALRQVLTSAPVDQTGLHVQAETDVTVDPLAPIDRVLPAKFTAAYPTTIPTLRVPTKVQGPGDVPAPLSYIVWRPASCAHVQLVRGRCPHGPDEVMISARSAIPTWGLQVGVQVELPGLPRDRADQASFGVAVPAPSSLRVVGTYIPRDVDDPFWFGHNYFDAHLGAGDDPDTIDDLFVDRAAFDQASTGTRGLAWVDYPLDPTRVTLPRVEALRRTVGAVQRTFPLTGQPTMTTQLGTVLDRAERSRTGLDSGTTLVTLQLLLLAWLVLFQVVAASAESRGPEVAIAKLRGLRPWDAAVFALGEPVALVALAAPLGMLAGWLATRALAATVLVSGVPVRLGTSSWLAGLTALAGGVVATVLATRRTLQRPILEQWRRAEEQVTRGRRTAIVDAVIATAAAIGLVALSRRGVLDDRHPSAVSLIGPALLVLAVALVGIRLLPVFGRVGADLSRGSRHLGLFLAVRQVSRRATEHRFAVLLAVASGVAVFSVAANDVVHHNETQRARAEVGATTVVSVQPQAGVDVIRAVAKVDPRGTWAMAANEWSPVGGSVGVTIQAVDMDRFSRLGFFDKAALGRYLPSLTAHLAHSVPLRTTAVRVDMHADGTFSRPTLDVTVVDAASRTITVVGPAVNHGAQSVVVPLPCAAGCRLIGLDLDRNVLDSSIMTGTWVVSSVDERAGASWSPVDAQLSAARAWRAGRRQTSGHDNVSASGTGLVDAFVAEPGGWPSVELADVPRPLPVLLTTDATVTTDTDPYVDDALGRQVPLSRVATVARLPRQLTSGGLADLTAARDGLPAFDRYGRWEVWLGADAPTDAFARLRAVGLVPGRPDTVAAHLQTLQQEGPALALRLFLFASFACSALALAAATLALAAAGRRRSFEMAALLAVGVRRVSLLRACVTEQILLLGTGLVLGVVPGLLAASIALPSVPEFADRSPVSLTYTASTSVVAGFVAILAGIVLGVAVVGGVALLRAAVPARLREATP